MKSRVKDIRIKVIPSKIANSFIKRHHYSGNVVPNSKLHFGAFLDKRLHGVMSFGSPMRKRITVNLVKDTKWNAFLELNRMAFDSYLPRNSESRSISVALKLIKKQAPHIKWIISFADGTMCGDGTIYRASGFHLIGIKKNKTIRRNPKTGELMQQMQAFHLKIINDFLKNWKPIKGFQIKYIYFLDKSYKKKLTVPILPYSKIKEVGASMYKGKRADVRLEKSR